jgi:acyl-coenzyme A thioesterase 9
MHACVHVQARDAQRAADVELLLQAARPYTHLPALAGYGVDTLPMVSTKLSNTLMTQPQHQNTAGRVFGGFLMRRAFEIAFACCCARAISIIPAAVFD